MALTPKKRKCRVCQRNDLAENMLLLGHTESKPGWCGGPRQGGRPAYAHAECQAQSEAQAAASQARHEDRLARAKAALADRDMDAFGRIMAE